MHRVVDQRKRKSLREGVHPKIRMMKSQNKVAVLLAVGQRGNTRQKIGKKAETDHPKENGTNLRREKTIRHQ